MRFHSKTARAAALGLYSVAALALGGVSLADETIPVPATTVGSAAHSPYSATTAPGASSVVFAARKEVVQSLPEDIAASTPDANAILAVPGEGYASLAALVADTDTRTPLNAQGQCLATAIFYEARSESLEGQLAVARVIINRAKSERFNDSLCGVVRQPGQFSFVRRGVIPAPNENRPAWKTSVAVARIAMDNGWASRAEGALYFHARRIRAGWSRPEVAVIDNHIFYR